MRREDTVVAPMPSFELPRRMGAGFDKRVDTTVETRVEGNVVPLPVGPMTRPPAPAHLTPPDPSARGATQPGAPPMARHASQPTTPPPPRRPSQPTMPPPAPPTYHPVTRASTQPVGLPLQAPAEVEGVLASLAAPADAADAAPAAEAKERGQVLVVFGCRGGAGATTLSVNVGAALARAGKRVCLLDLDLQLGDVFVALDLEPNTSLAALAREAGTIDGAALRRRLQRHDSGIYALTQVGRLDDVDPQLADRMPALLAMLCDHFDVVIVDGVRDFGDHALAALDMADRIALVVTQDVPAVRRAARVTQLFRKLGYSDRKIQLVVNRHTPKSIVSEQEIERAVGLPVVARVRNDYKRMTAALDDGALLVDVARDSAVARDVASLADVLAGTAPVPKVHAGGRPGLLSRVFKRGK